MLTGREPAATTKLPTNVISELENAGAKVITYGKPKIDRLVCVSFMANSDAHKKFIEFCSQFDKDEESKFDPIVYSLLANPNDGVIPPHDHSLDVFNKNSKI